MLISILKTCLTSWSIKIKIKQIENMQNKSAKTSVTRSNPFNNSPTQKTDKKLDSNTNFSHSISSSFEVNISCKV